MYIGETETIEDKDYVHRRAVDKRDMKNANAVLQPVHQLGAHCRRERKKNQGEENQGKHAHQLGEAGVTTWMRSTPPAQCGTS